MDFFLSEIEQCLHTLKIGQVILYPTDTVWGIGCDALNEIAVDKIFQIKDRPKQKSLIILLSDTVQLKNYTDELSDELLYQIQNFQTPTTTVFRKAKNLPKNVINEDGSVAIRVTKDPFCTALIEQLGHPIISTSANVSGANTPAIFKQIDTVILEGVDYITKYRQDDESIASASRIVSFDADGSLVYLR
jgi:L-threonylcarbamoyladenylate synthase